MKQSTEIRIPLAKLALGLVLMVCAVSTSFGEPHSYRIHAGSADEVGTASVKNATLPNQIAVVALNSVEIKKGALVSGSVVVNDFSTYPTLRSTADLVIDQGAVLDGDATSGSIEVNKDGEIKGAVTADSVVVKNGICPGCASPSDYDPLIFDPLPGFESRTPGGNPLNVPSGSLTIPNAGMPDRIYSDVTVGAGATLVLTGGDYAFSSLSIGQGGKLLFEAPTNMTIVGLFNSGKFSEVGPASGSGITAKDIIIYVSGTGNQQDPNASPYAVFIGRQSETSANFYAPNGTFHLDKSFQGVDSVFTGAVIAKDVSFGDGSIVNVDSFFANKPPVAEAQSIETSAAMIEITLTCVDPENEELEFSIESGPGAGGLDAVVEIVPPLVPPDRESGIDCNTQSELCSRGPVTSATVKYTPNDPGAEDAFTFSCADPHLAKGMAVVDINAPDNSPPPPPVTAVDACPDPRACETDVTEGIPTSIGLDAEGPEDSALTFCILSPLPNGTLTDSEGMEVASAPYQLPGPALIYAPRTAAGTTDSIVFEARDTGSCGDPCSSSNCDQATFLVNITERIALAGEDQQITTNLNQPVEFSVFSNSGGVARSGAAPYLISKAAVALPAEIAGGVADTPPEDGSGDVTDIPPLVAAGVEVPGSGTASVSITDPDTDATSVSHPVDTFLFKFFVGPGAGNTRDLRITPVSDLLNSGGIVAIDNVFANPGSTECFNCSPFRHISAGDLTSLGNGGSGPATWTLSGVTFTDGGIASGTFEYDADTDTVSSWDINVTGGDTASFPVFNYNNVLTDHSVSKFALNELSRDLVTLDASTDGTDLVLEARLDPVFVQTGIPERTRIVFLLDTDQDAATGCDPADGPPCGPASGGSASTDTMGWEFRVDIPTPSASSTSGLALIRRDYAGGGSTFVQNIPFSTVGDADDFSGNNNFGFTVTIPLSTLDADEGNINIKAFANVLDNNQNTTSPSIGSPTDFIPDLGSAPAELQLALAGTVRTQIEFDISSLGTTETALDGLDSATVTLTTEKGANDSVDTFWFAGDDEGDGALSPSDFGAAASQLPNVVMPVPDVADGDEGTFTFSVLGQIRRARLANPPRDFLILQGRVDEQLTGFSQGLQIRTTSAASGKPILSITTPPLVLEPEIEILSVPLANEGQIWTIPTPEQPIPVLVVAGATFPNTTSLLFVPSQSFIGVAQLEYQVTQGTEVDTALVEFTVLNNDECTIVGRPLGCLPDEPS